MYTRIAPPGQASGYKDSDPGAEARQQPPARPSPDSGNFPPVQDYGQAKKTTAAPDAPPLSPRDVGAMINPAGAALKGRADSPALRTFLDSQARHTRLSMAIEQRAAGRAPADPAGRAPEIPDGFNGIIRTQSPPAPKTPAPPAANGIIHTQPKAVKPEKAKANGIIKEVPPPEKKGSTGKKKS